MHLFGGGLATETFTFNRMISEDTALYDYQGGPTQNYLTGQIAVVVDPSFEMELGPATYHDWKIEPLGTLAGTNGLGAPIEVPLVRFWGYCDSPPNVDEYVQRGKFPPCMQDLSPELLFGVPAYPSATQRRGNTGFSVFSSPGKRHVEAQFETPDPIEKVRAFYKEHLGKDFTQTPQKNVISLELKRGNQETSLVLVPCDQPPVGAQPWCYQGYTGTRLRLHTSGL